MTEDMNNCPVVLYTAPDGKTQFDVKLENETVWLTREQMATLFKQYLIQGYVIDQRRLDHYNELKDVVRLMSRAI